MSNYKFSLDPILVEKVKTKNRKIKTAIPTPGTKKILNEIFKRESRSMHGQLPIIWNKAIDYNVYDINGNKWIDFTSTIFVTNVGHSNLRVNKAIKETLDNSLYSSYAYLNLKRNEYLKKLINFVGPPFEKAFLLSAGTEATEACLKLMRMHGQKIKKKKLGIVCFEGNWHGRTLGAQMMSSNEAQKKWIEDRDPEIHFLKFP